MLGGNNCCLCRPSTYPGMVIICWFARLSCLSMAHPNIWIASDHPADVYQRRDVRTNHSWWRSSVRLFQYHSEPTGEFSCLKNHRRPYRFTVLVCYLSLALSFSCKQKVEKRVQPLADMRELASAANVEDFGFAYSNLLQNQPDCPVGHNFWSWFSDLHLTHCVPR